MAKRGSVFRHKVVTDNIFESFKILYKVKQFFSQYIINIVVQYKSVIKCIDNIETLFVLTVNYFILIFSLFCSLDILLLIVMFLIFNDITNVFHILHNYAVWV